MRIKPPTAKDHEMMAKAIAEAKVGIDAGGTGIAALLLWRNEILALNRNRCLETGDLTAHAEIVVLRDAAKRLNEMTEAEKAEITIYTTLEPCLLCTAAISFVGIKRVVYSALTEDANEEQIIAKGITIDKINNLLTRGALELVPGVQREQGKELLKQIGISKHN